MRGLDVEAVRLLVLLEEGEALQAVDGAGEQLGRRWWVLCWVGCMGMGLVCCGGVVRGFRRL